MVYSLVPKEKGLHRISLFFTKRKHSVDIVHCSLFKTYFGKLNFTLEEPNVKPPHKIRTPLSQTSRKPHRLLSGSEVKKQVKTIHSSCWLKKLITKNRE